MIKINGFKFDLEPFVKGEAPSQTTSQAVIDKIYYMHKLAVHKAYVTMTVPKYRALQSQTRSVENK